MCFLGSKYARNAFAAGATPRTPLGELTVLPQTLLLDLRGLLLREGEEKRGREEREGAGRGEGKGRKEEGREGSEGLTPTFLYPPLPLHTITNRENFYFKVSNRLSTRIHRLDFINVLVRHSI